MEVDNFSIKDNEENNKLTLEVTLNGNGAIIYRDVYTFTHHGNCVKFARESSPIRTWELRKEWRNIFVDDTNRIYVNGFYLKKNKQLLNFLKRIIEKINEFVGFSRDYIIQRIIERIGEDEFVNLRIIRERIFAT